MKSARMEGGYFLLWMRVHRAAGRATWRDVWLAPSLYHTGRSPAGFSVQWSCAQSLECERVSKDTGSLWEFVLKQRMTCPHGSFHRATPVSVNQKPDICEVSGKIQLTRLSARVVQKWCVKPETNETIGLKPLPTSLPFSIHLSSLLSFVSAFPFFSFSFCLLLYIWKGIKDVHTHANAEIDENAF